MSSDSLEGSSVNIMLLISFSLSVLMVCLCLFPRMVFVWQCMSWSILSGLGVVLSGSSEL